MFLCPKDESELQRHAARGNVYWSCPNCRGRTATTGTLRRTASARIVDHLWELARGVTAEGPRRCPACVRPMKTVSLALGPGSMELDVCTRCYFVWFDAAEFEELPQRSSKEAAEKKLPLDARLLLAKMDVEALDTRPDFELPPSDPPPEGWKAVPAFFGLPVKQESHAFAHLPLATWMMAGIVAVFSGLALLDLSEVVKDFGLIPSEPWRYGGLTLLTSFFLHGSLPHLAGNLYFLLTFGDDVEDYLGSARYLMVLLLALLAGSALHAWLREDSSVPLVGASSAISGILTFYGLQFPRARIGFLLRFPSLFFMRWVNLRAWVYVLFWIVLQTIGAFRQSGAYTQVSAWAHLGGVAAGFLFWFLWPGERVPAADGGATAS